MHWAFTVVVKYLLHVCLLQQLALLASAILRLQLYFCCSTSAPLKALTCKPCSHYYNIGLQTSLLEHGHIVASFFLQAVYPFYSHGYDT